MALQASPRCIRGQRMSEIMKVTPRRCQSGSTTDTEGTTAEPTPSGRIWNQREIIDTSRSESSLPTILGSLSGRSMGKRILNKKQTEKRSKICMAVRCHSAAQRQVEQDYEVSSKVIGAGSSGSVHLAVARRGDKNLVAIKTFSLRKMSATKRSRLQSEIGIYLRMDHPHVARLFDVYETDSKMSLVMECAEGGDLFDRVAKVNHFSENAAAHATRQMLLAVRYLHSHGVVHRDLKLENFVYDKQGSSLVKMIDFGFSKYVSSQDRMRTTCGTLQYVAPEVLNKCYTNQCDLWSMGVIVFILLSGKLPFHGKSDEQVKEVRRGRIYFNTKDWEKVSSIAIGFVKSLLVVDPAKRLDSKQALEHRWITGNDHDTRVRLDPSIFNAIHSWCVAPKLQRMCMSIVAWALTTKQCAAVQEVFLALDSDHDGKITLAELQEAATGKVQFPQETVQEMFEAIGGIELHYSDFIAAMAMSKLIELNDDLLRATFEKFDVDNSGYITFTKLHNILGDTFEGSEVETILNEVGHDKDGKITFQEFANHTNGTPWVNASAGDFTFQECANHTNGTPLVNASADELSEHAADEGESHSRTVNDYVNECHPAAALLNTDDNVFSEQSFQVEHVLIPTHNHKCCETACAVQ